jgi:hypothetical protein
MIEPIFPSKQRHHLTTLILATLVVLTAFPAWVEYQRDHRTRLATTSEYHAARPMILSMIGEAIENHDLDTLHRLQKKYAEHVPDRQFKAALESGLATLTHRETEAELAVAKLLDISRHREELGSRHFVDPQPKQATVNNPQQKLSVLPR